MYVSIYYFFIFVLTVMLPFPSTCLAADEDTKTVDQIVERANHMAYYQGKDGRAQVKMTITDNQDRNRHREFTILRRDTVSDNDGITQSGDQSYYVFFHRPADVNKTVFMVWKHTGSNDDRWLYLPALDLVKRIAASDERTSFVGSHFFYEDVSGRGIHEDNHTLLETTDNYYILKNTPKNPDLVTFSFYKMWIHKESYLPVKTEYFDKENQSYRQYEVLKVETISGHPTVVKASMKDSKIGGQTVMEYDRVEYDIGLPEDIFSERYLRHPPRKYLR